jgi:hypothetical protein
MATFPEQPAPRGTAPPIVYVSEKWGLTPLLPQVLWLIACKGGVKAGTWIKGEL